MTSLPNQSSGTFLLATPTSRRGHRHKRLAAISGDFDIMGLGLFSPEKSSTPSNILSSTPTTDDLDKHFHFNNADDFSNKATPNDFNFPTKSPDLMISTPPRYFHQNKKNYAYNLNSPIKLNNRRSFSNTKARPPAFDPTPSEGLIDLDEVLNANLHIGAYHKRADLLPADVFGGDDDFFASPFTYSKSNFGSSPLTNPLSQQPIQESSDLIEEEDELVNEFQNPHETITGLYANESASSSSSSLKRVGSTQPGIEKTLSNSSKDSFTSTNLISSPASKRSGAKANRYQSFYDQSFKITNALKFSSSDSINIVRSNSSGHSLNAPPNPFMTKGPKSLGHSSSLPSMGSSTKRPTAQRVIEPLRLKPESRHVSPPPGTFSSGSPIDIEANRVVEPTQPRAQALALAKNISNSPISVTSEVSSTVLSTNDSSTDHSSVMSQGDKKTKDFVNDIPDTPVIVVSKDGAEESCASSTNSTFRQADDVTIVVPPLSISEDRSPVSSPSGASIGSASVAEVHSPIPITVCSPSTPTIRPPYNSTPLMTSAEVSPKSSSKRQSPRRKLSPSEEKILQSTQIPVFRSPAPLSKTRRKLSKDRDSFLFPSYSRKSLVASMASQQPISSQEPSKYRHSKSKSFSFVIPSLSSNETARRSNDDLSSVSLRKNNRVFGWLRKKL